MDKSAFKKVKIGSFCFDRSLKDGLATQFKDNLLLRICGASDCVDNTACDVCVVNGLHCDVRVGLFYTGYFSSEIITYLRAAIRVTLRDRPDAISYNAVCDQGIYLPLNDDGIIDWCQVSAFVHEICADCTNLNEWDILMTCENVYHTDILGQ